MKNFKTKKIIGYFAMAIVFMLMGCKEETHTIEKAPPPEKEVIVVPPPPPLPPAEKPTSISLSKDGVKVKTEKVDVDVNVEK